VTVTSGHLELLALPPAGDLPMPDDLVLRRIRLAGDPHRRPRVRLSPNGDVLAVAGERPYLHLYDLTPRESALTGPMGSLTRIDLTDVAELHRLPDIGTTSRQALTLLLACLEYRYRHDIGIGDAASTAIVSDFDIELREG
jgi:hypothetical protein